VENIHLGDGDYNFKNIQWGMSKFKSSRLFKKKTKTELFGGGKMIWYMNGITKVDTEYIEAHADLNWRIVCNGDYKK
jgi:hypothetical protein